ncbi:LytTR family DNA-binding domain-containing protein [Limibacter armeniacum]|uniref:LytR/AlgR family response regulator transcription factor n=1 Tax=Limibacter armeniacum TaxID=466084 RepID=UPI002FE6933B
MNYLLINRSFLPTHLSFSVLEVCLIAASITFLSIILTVELAPRLFISIETKENWTIGKEVLLVLLLLLTIAFFNNIVFSFLLEEPISNFLKRFGNAAFYVLGLGSIPTLMVVWLNYTIILKRNLQTAHAYNTVLEKRINQQGIETDKTIQIQTNNKHEVITLNLNCFIFAKSEGNYVDIVTKQDGEVVYTPYRISIKKLMDSLSDVAFIMSPHRSYIINLNKITAASGNARNFKLSLENVAEGIPISRNKYQAFKTAFFSQKP